MKRENSRPLSRQVRATVAIVALLGLALAAKNDLGMNLAGATGPESIPNNQPVRNPGGKSATFSTQGSVNLTRR